MASDTSLSLEGEELDLVSEGDSLVSPADRQTIRVLVVDDDPTSLQSCESVLTSLGYSVDVEKRGREAIRRLKSGKFHIALLDQNMPDTDGLDVLASLEQQGPGPLSIMITGYATVDASVKALRAGAWDYLPKPFTATQLQVLVDRATHALLRMRTLSGETEGERDHSVLVDNGVRILGVSEAMRDVVKKAMKIARTDASVFITGESGTGKELISKFIHLESRRAGESFVAINCAALPGELLESEMFGHRRGAFTGAVRDKAGLLEGADKGTCFLDELCEMPVGLQPKLLRVLQDGVLRRVGSEKDDAVVDVRFISATNREPEGALEEGVLRKDLYYRLRAVPLTMPPLRERREDIPVLAEHFVEHFWKRHRSKSDTPPGLAPETRERLVRHDWPGNVRELQNVLEQVVVMADSGEEIQVGDLPPLDDVEVALANSGKSGSLVSKEDLEVSFHDAKENLVDRFEMEYLSTVVSRADGNMSEAARQAGIARTTLYRLLNKYELL